MKGEDNTLPPPLAGEGREGVVSLLPSATKIPKKPNWHVKPVTRNRARALRTNSTKAERVLWRILRAHRLKGVGFRRQTPIGPYIVDFLSHSAKLVIEVDGGQHFDHKQQARDAAPDRFLRSKGFCVLRFSNNEVMNNIEGLWEVIAAACEAASPSLPLPHKGGGHKGVPTNQKQIHSGRRIHSETSSDALAGGAEMHGDAHPCGGGTIMRGDARP